LVWQSIFFGVLCMVGIRTFKISDSPAVSRLIHKIVTESKDYPRDIQNSVLDEFRPMKVALMNMNCRHCLVAEDDGTIVAAAAIKGTTLRYFFVHPEYRQSRVGALLLNAMEVKANLLKIRLLTVGAGPAVIPIFEREGYERTGKRTARSDGYQIELMKRLA
jgi:N-acetylglutamate synthase-like GNAT family acetyltransferase